MLRPLALSLLLAASASAQPAVFGLDASAALAHVEAQLQSLPEACVAFAVTSDSAHTSRLSGSLQWSAGEAALHALGYFAPEPVHHGFRARADSLRFTVRGPRGVQRHTVPSGPALKEALVVGLVRMGVLHNLARLTAGLAPDHAEGGAAEWVQVENLRWGPQAQGRPLQFGLVVAGVPAGEASLWLDPQTGLPARRAQRVAFPGGVMVVAETFGPWRAGACPGPAFDPTGD